MSQRSPRGRRRLLAVLACCTAAIWIALYLRGGSGASSIAAAQPADALPAATSDEHAPGAPTAPAGERRLAPLVIDPPQPPLGLWSEESEVGAITGSVRTLSGEPIALARCTLRPGTPSSGFGGDAQATLASQVSAALRTDTTDATGRFAFPIESGWWSLEVAADGYALRRADHLRADDHRVLVLEPAVQLTVYVRGEGGLPLESVEVALLDDFRNIRSRPLDQRTTDASGVTVFDRVAPGDAYVMLRHAGYQHQLEIVPIAPTSRWQEAVLDMQPGVRLLGRVVEQTDAAPIPAASVRIEAYAKGQSVVLELTADADGRFATEALYAEGEPVVVTAAAPAHAELSRMVIVRAQEGTREREIELALAAGDRGVRGRAVDEAGRPLSGVSVAFVGAPPMGRGREALATALTQVTPHPERWRRGGVTDAAGFFELSGLAPGIEYVLRLAGEHRSPGVRWVPTGAGGEVLDIGDVELAPAASIFGYVRFEEDGEPVEGELVRAQLEIILSESEFGSEFDSYRPTAWWRPLQAVTEGDGSFRIDDVAPGSYDVKLGSLEAGRVLVTAGRACGPVRILAPRALFDDGVDMRNVEGFVRGEDGEAVGEGFVALFRASEASDGDAQPVSMTMTDFRGHYELRAPVGETYVLRVSSVLGGYRDHESELGKVEALEGSQESLRVDVHLLRDEVREPLMGLVLDPGGRPVEGISVSLQPPENAYCGCLSFETRTSADGLVSFKELADDDYTVVARDPLGRWAPRTVAALRPGSYFEIVFE